MTNSVSLKASGSPRKVHLHLTVRQARKLLQAISGPSVSDETLADIYNDLETVLLTYVATQHERPRKHRA